ncbi:hypothetical protein KUD11_02665 [Roseovarius sp. LXJ103]|uniref:hypothetical protein n=1 Tax=Roseovarius carneus TaxID=2853164 RepID=UPI000D60AF53|nr:hypothetical protein [Roseovarius carneus]MBZ8117542.1 hypothetical protein [Roseovarius carneus]PWE36663.1 hypothetical protein DD563_12275 [Pelagicola sp. LXJ1103]
MSPLAPLVAISQTLYQAEQAKLQDVIAQEARLRAALGLLDARREASAQLPVDQLAAPRAVGADLLWQGWTLRTRERLNVELAQILVRKAERMGALRLAFGKLEATKSLLENEKKALRRKAQGRANETAQAFMILKGPPYMS